jgi:hypothetical protein
MTAGRRRPVMKTEQDLMKVGNLPLERYEHEQLAALTVYAIHWLREWGIRPTVESIAVMSFRLFPERFRMNLFPAFPDANRTLRSLLQCGPKYRGWLSGSNRRGYAITPTGAALVDELTRRIGYPAVGGKPLGVPTAQPRTLGVTRHERARDLDFKSEVSALRASRLFQRSRESALEERDVIHAYSALGVFDHTPASAKRQRLNDLRDSARKAGDKDVSALLDQIEASFPSLFREG